MAGRQLRRQREAALAAMSDTEVSDLARGLMPALRPTMVRNLLLGARGDVRATLTAMGGDQRATLAVVLANDPSTARLAIAMHWHDPKVDQALGITRTPGQRHS